MDDYSDYEPEIGDSSNDSDVNDSDFVQQTSPNSRVGSIFSFSFFLGLMHCVLTLFSYEIFFSIIQPLYFLKM